MMVVVEILARELGVELDYWEWEEVEDQEAVELGVWEQVREGRV
jgi:hypothetical protein